MKKLTVLCILLTLLALLLSGCTGNKLTFSGGELSVTVSAVDGKKITVSTGNGLVNPVMGNGDLANGEQPQGEQGGEIGGSLIENQNEQGGALGKDPGAEGDMQTPPDLQEGENPRGGTFDPNGNTDASATFRVNEKLIYTEQNGSEVSASLSDISVGSMLKLTLDKNGKITKILITTAQQMQNPEEQR